LRYFIEPPPTAPLLVPPTPGLLGEVVLPDVLPVPVLPVPGLPVPEVLLPVPDVLLELPVLPLRSWRRQSSFAMPVNTSQRVELELAPVELLEVAPAGSEVALLFGSAGRVVALPGVGVLGEPAVLGEVVVLPVPAAPPMVPPPGLVEVWAMAKLAAPRNAAATAE
jgi:hypothetical protein